MAEKNWKAEYKKKLLDPRWQRKRLEILERDGFACCSCQETAKTLHVHHLKYQWGKNPWEYNNDDLETLCVDCHEAETQTQADIKESEQQVLEALRSADTYTRLSIGQRIATVPGAIKAFFQCLDNDRRDILLALGEGEEELAAELLAEYISKLKVDFAADERG